MNDTQLIQAMICKPCETLNGVIKANEQLALPERRSMIEALRVIHAFLTRAPVGWQNCSRIVDAMERANAKVANDPYRINEALWHLLSLQLTASSSNAVLTQAQQ